MPDETRTWEIVHAFGWPPSVIDEQPALTLDWLLAMERVRRDRG